MNRTWVVLAGFGLGMAVGLAYFAGLWLTVQRAVVSARPQRLLTLSRVARLLPTFAVMVTVARYDVAMFLAMLPGFLSGRSLVSRQVARPAREESRASHP